MTNPRLILNLLIIFILLTVCPSIQAQYSKAQGWAEQGGVTVTIGGITTGAKYQTSYPSCTVTVYDSGTSNLSTIYSDSGGTPKSNPFTASATGYWFFFASSANYDVQFSGTGISVPFTLGSVPAGSAGGGSVSIGTINSQSKSANGLVVSGSSIVAQTADASFPGMISTGTQTIAGAKTFNGIIALGTGTNFNEPAWASTGGTSILGHGIESSSGSPNTSGNPSLTFQTYRGGGSLGVGVFGYQFGLYAVGAGGAGGDTYTVGILNRYDRNMTGFANGDYFQTGIKSHVVLDPTNKPVGANLYGFNEIRAERLVTGVRAVGLQTQADNNSVGDTDDDASTLDSTISLNVATGGTKYNSIGIQFESGATGATSMAVAIRPKRNSVRLYINDFINGGVYDLAGGPWSSSRVVSVTNGSPTITGTGTRFQKEVLKGDQVSVDGVTWYEVASTPASDTSLTLTTNYSGGTASNQPLIKTVQPLRLVRPSFITSTDGTNTYRIIGMSASNVVSLDKDGRGAVSGANLIVSNNNTQKLTLGAVSGSEAFPGIWFGSAAPSLSNYSLLYESSLNATVVNGATGVYLRVGNQAVAAADFNLGFLVTNYIEGSEITDPSAPSANSARLYVRDNGSGKTQLVVRFSSGAVQVIATQP